MKLLLLIIKSRFTTPYVILLAISTIYMALQALFAPKLGLALFAQLSIAVVAVVSALAVLGGGPLILRADVDFLLQMPVDRLALASSLYIAQLLLYWPFFLYVVSMTLLVPYLGLAGSLLSSILLTAFAVSTSVLFYRFPLRLRGFVAVLLGLWLISPIFGFSYSPGAALLGSRMGYIAAAISTTALSALAVRELRRPENYALFTGGAEITGGELSFRGVGPVKAIYLLRLYNLSTLGRGVWGGMQLRTSRFGMGRAVLAVAMASALYLLAELIYRSPIPAIIAVFAASATSASLMGASAVANERLWISAAALGPRYFRHMLLGIAASTSVFLSPLASAGVAAWLLGSRYGAGVAIAALGQTPAFAAIYAYLFALISPYQIGGEHTWPMRIGLRTMALSLSAFTSFVAGAAAVESPRVGLYISAAFYAVLLILTSRRPLEKALESLIANGFV